MAAYRAIGWKLGREYPEWVHADVTSGRAGRRRILVCASIVPAAQPPKGMARLTNLDIAAIQLLSVAFLGLTVGVVPHLMFPEIRGRCVDPDGRLLAALDAVVPTGVDVRAVAAVHQRRSTVVSAALGDGRIASWLRAEAGPVDQLLPVNMTAFAIAGPAPLQSGGTATFYGTGDLPVAKAEACAAKRAGLPAASRSPTG